MYSDASFFCNMILIRLCACTSQLYVYTCGCARASKRKCSGTHQTAHSLSTGTPGSMATHTHTHKQQQTHKKTNPNPPKCPNRVAARPPRPCPPAIYIYTVKTIFTKLHAISNHCHHDVALCNLPSRPASTCAADWGWQIQNGHI